ncbi:proteophosphoglycan ppg4 [Rhodotorula toruloides]|uniref:Proteophosphoglycan ppg4 n=1 Tax=Rhodotorula toruloides TaxID=5286 RepID=A0A511KCG6_RHOTO|nr:proteophosphoglycan ppg4 [Rhodotorula toruloides]
MVHISSHGSANSLDEAPNADATASTTQRPRHGFVARRPASTPLVPPSERVSPTLQRFHSSSGPSSAAHDPSTASPAYHFLSSPAHPLSLSSVTHSSYTLYLTQQYPSGPTSSWSDLAYPRQDEQQSSGILRGGAGGRVGSSDDGMRRELSDRSTSGDAIVARIKEEDEEVERRERWALEASLAQGDQGRFGSESAGEQRSDYYGPDDAYYTSTSSAPPSGDVGGEYDFAFESPELVASRRDSASRDPSSEFQSAYDGNRAVGHGGGSGSYVPRSDNSPISPLSLYADEHQYNQYQLQYAYQPSAHDAYYDHSASPESPYQPFFVPAGPRPVPFASTSSHFGRPEPSHLTYSHSAPSGIEHYQPIVVQPSSYDHEEVHDPAAHFAPYYASYEMRSPMTAFQSFHIASRPQSPSDEFPSPMSSLPQSVSTTMPPLFPTYDALRQSTTSPPSSRRSLLANALLPRQNRPQSLDIAQAFVKVEDPDSPTFADSPVPLSPSIPRAPSPTDTTGKGKKRRSSSSASAVDPDWTPSSPTRTPSSTPKVHPTRVSPITGKPVKVISPRSWPPKDQHKRIYTCDFPGCDKSFGRPSARDTHMRSHSGVKPFMCPIPSCGRTFSVFSNLKRHMIVHPTVDFRHVTVNDLPLIHWVPDADPEASKAAGGEGGRLEWIDEDDEEGEELAPAL